jgi:hypothetical protein
MARPYWAVGIGYAEDSPRHSSSEKIHLGRATWAVGVDSALDVARIDPRHAIPSVNLNFFEFFNLTWIMLTLTRLNLRLN